MRGAFITVEGIEGVGKSSGLAAMQRLLEGRGKTVRITREPGGTALGERLRELILHEAHAQPPTPETEALLMFAARAEHIRHVIEPALARGEWVVCDRFTDATFAYQGEGRGVPRELLECLRTGIQRGLEPDLTLWLDAPVAVGRARIGDRMPDHFEREQEAFFERVRDGYRTLAETEPGRIARIDAAEPVELVQREIERALERFITERER